MSIKTARWTLLSGALLLCASPVAWAAESEVAELSGVTVSSQLVPSLAADSVVKAKKDAQKTPGNAMVVSAQQFQQTATGNLKDTVSYVPGVYAQERSGPETRLSIRGSGLSIPWVVKGVSVTRNGTPLYEADGWYHSQLVEPLTARYTEVYTGANALKLGASNLGGAINYVTYDGYTAPTLSASIEGDNQGFGHAQLASGAAFDNGWDVYTSLSTLQSDGYRDHAETDSKSLYSNIGYRHNDIAETRVHLDVTQSKQELPGAITWKQLNDDPKQANANDQGAGAANNFDRYRVEVQHIRSRDENSRITSSFFVDSQKVDHPLFWGVIEKDFATVGAGVKGEHFKSWFGDDHHFVWGADLLAGSATESNYVNLGNATKGARNHKTKSSALTADVFAEDRWLLTHSLEAVVGAKWLYTNRKSRINSAANGRSTPHQSYMSTTPKLGFLWQPNGVVQLFTNVSKSFEAPVLYEFNDAYQKQNGAKLKAQKATTWEVGTRGETEHWQWQLAVYRSWVEREILAEMIPGAWGLEPVPFNAKKTLHDGVELGIDGYIPITDKLGNVHWRFAGTMTRFTYRNDDQYGKNYLPGVPREFGNFDLLYEHPEGFYAGPTFEAASEYFTDYMNRVLVPSYAVMGLKTGYQAHSWSVFVNASNLLDKKYVASTEIVNDPSVSSDLFLPGQGRTISAGIRVNFK